MYYNHPGKDLINSDGNEKTNDNNEIIAYVVIGVIIAIIILLLLILIVCYTSLKRHNISCVHLKGISYCNGLIIDFSIYCTIYIMYVIIYMYICI